MRPQRAFKEPARMIEHAFAEQRAPDLQHEVVIVLEAEGQHALEARQRGGTLTELEQDLAQPGECILVIGIETARLFKRAPRPRELLARELRIAQTDMQLDGVGIQPQTLAQRVYGFVVLTCVVELMCT